MTQQEQDAILGRTRREFKEAMNQLGALKVVNGQIAGIAKKLAEALEHYPDRLMVGRLPQGSLAVALTDAKYIYTPEDAGRLSPESLLAHLHEYSAVRDRIEKLRQSLIEQGDGDPETRPR